MFIGARDDTEYGGHLRIRNGYIIVGLLRNFEYTVAFLLSSKSSIRGV